MQDLACRIVIVADLYTLMTMNSNNSSMKIKYLPYSQSSTGNCSTAWRKTGSTFVYTLFVRFGEECSKSLCVTAVENGVRMYSQHITSLPYFPYFCTQVFPSNSTKIEHKNCHSA